MPLPRSWARTLGATTALTVAAGVLMAPSTAAQPSVTQPSVTQSSVAQPSAEAASRASAAPSEETRLLPDGALGARAVRALERNGALAEAARRNGRTPRALRELLVSDPTFGVDRAGRLLVADELHRDLHDHAGEADATDEAAPSGRAGLAAPLAQTLDLHSRPGSTRTIYLDVDGHDLTDSWWEADGFHAGWDPAKDGPQFSDGELRLLQEVWARVAEDYAPYDVNVTTADPGQDALVRSSPSDDVFGMRALLSDSVALADAVAGPGTSTIGMAYIDIFNRVGADSPALVFSGRLGPDAAVVADTITHEVGHTLSLRHVSDSSTQLHHALMYPSVGRAPLTVWTRVDLDAIPAHGLSVVADEPGTSRADAPLTTTSPVHGTIAASTDVDWFRYDGCTTIAATARVATHGPNLDLHLSLHDAGGSQLAADAPQTTYTNGVLGGLDASLERTVTRGTYYLAVRGAGSAAGGGAGVYDNTASLGNYTLDVSGCTSVPATAPGAPTAAAAVTTQDGTTTLTWSPPTTTGGAPVTGYVVRLGSGPAVTLPATARSHSAVTGAGVRVTASVAAVNTAGTSTPATVASLLPPPAPVHVGMESYYEISWLPVVVQQTEDPGTHLEIKAGGWTWGPVPLDRRTLIYKEDLPLGSVFEARVTNAAGASPWKSFTVGATAPPAPTPGPWPTPSPTPSPTPGPTPTESPSPSPTAVPSPSPTTSPSPSPTVSPSPTSAPTAAPTGAPTPGPTAGPTASPTTGPTSAPTASPTTAPVPAPKVRPGKPRQVKAASGPRGGPKTVRVRWRAPKASGSHPVTRYRIVLRKVNARGKVVGKARIVVVTTRKGRVTRQVRLGQGRWKVRVRAGSAAGWSAYSRWSRPVTAR